MRRGQYFCVAGVFVTVVFFLVRNGPEKTVYENINNKSYVRNLQPESEWFFDNENVNQNDPAVLKYIQDYHLTPPSTEPYKLAKPKGNPSQFKYQLKTLFGDKRNGFFIECGANDGEFYSNTLALERDQNWTGLLIEANQFIVPNLKKKHRKAWIADVCLSLKPYPQKVKFLHRSGAERPWYKAVGIIDEGKASWTVGHGRDPKNYIDAGPVDCFPLFSLLSAINVTQVDYFSLDIEGVEFKVLQAIPFDVVDIRVLSIESNLIPEGVPALIDLMKSKGFHESFKIRKEIFFVKNSLSKL